MNIILLLTTIIGTNAKFGNRLQFFTLNSFLQHYGDLTFFRIVLNEEYSVVYHVRLFLAYTKRSLVPSVAFVPAKERLSPLRVYKSEGFIRHFISDINCLLLSISGDDLFSVDCCMIGSDQVRNYRWVSKDILALQLSSFVPNNLLTISHAVSFDVLKVEDDAMPIFRKSLPRFHGISICEGCGTKLVKEMNGLDTKVVLYPTLMLTVDRWIPATLVDLLRMMNGMCLHTSLNVPMTCRNKISSTLLKERECTICRILNLRDKGPIWPPGRILPNCYLRHIVPKILRMEINRKQKVKSLAAWADPYLTVKLVILWRCGLGVKKRIV